MQTITKFLYYAKSIFTIINGFSNPIPVLLFFLNKTYPGDRYSRQVKLKKSGLIFWVRTPMDVWSIKETFLDDFYRFSQSGNLQDGIIIDIGAGIGEFAIQAAAACPDCKIIGFEPFPDSFALFERNIALNGLKNVCAVEAAVTSFPGTLIMDTSSGNPLQYRMQTGLSAGKNDSIKTVGLMEYLDQQVIKKCDYLKLDCEGSEYDILLPLSIQELHRFNQIVMEYHDLLTTHNHNELVDCLNSAGFRVELVINKVHPDLGYIYAQLL